MKKITLAILVLILISTGFATSSPTIEETIYTNPKISFKLVDKFDEDNALIHIRTLFGARIVNAFQVYEVLDFEVQENWGVIEFIFLQNFTNEDTIIAIFENDVNYVILFLECQNGIIPIDFSFVPTGLNRMYLISDYESSN